MKFLTPFTILFLILLILLIQESLFSVMADKQFIKKTCKGTPSPSLCLSILLPNPKSQNADLTGLALIVVDAVKDKGVDTLQKIEALKNSRPDLTEALTKCGEVYKTVVDVDVPLAITALKLGNPKFGEDGMADSSVESEACERSFGEHGQASPMTDVNKGMSDVANVARAIIRMLL